jgi:hypothetical protein
VKKGLRKVQLWIEDIEGEEKDFTPQSRPK